MSGKIAARADRFSSRIEISGQFSLRAASEFGFGPTGAPPPFDGAMRLAFPLDGGRGYGGAVLRQPEPDGPVEVVLTLVDGGDPERALAQVARTVSLDHDGAAFAGLGAGDPVLGALQSAHPGQRPVLFHSPYEAAAWAIISARRPAAQAAQVRAGISERCGVSFELAGRSLHAFPQPPRLIEASDSLEGLSAEKQARLRGVAQAALAGEIDVSALRAAGPEQAYSDLQRLKGLGPFYAGLVVLRACGFADAMLPIAEPRVLAHAARFYGRSEPPTLEWLEGLAERWRPFRTWAMVLIRLAGDRGTSVPGGTASDSGS